MAEQNLQMTRETDYSVSFQVIQSGLAVNLTGGTLKMTAKYRYIDLDGNAVFQIFTPSTGIVVNDAVNGKATWTVPASATSALPKHQIILVYDLRFTSGAGLSNIILYGTLTVLPDVTNTIP